ncbi:MAG: PilZ domain-containing protein [Acidobacteriota bacterium]
MFTRQKRDSDSSFSPGLSAGPDRRLSIGQAISISLLQSCAEQAATVTKTSPDEISLELSTPTSPLSFQEGEQVRIKCLEEGVVYCWDAEVVEISGPGNKHVEVSIRGEGVTVERRKSLRVSSSIPFSFMVIDADETYLVGERVLNVTTQDITVGGLKFETSLPLNVGDTLEMNLHLSPSQQVNAVGWVARSEPVERDGKYLNSVALEFLQLEAEEQKQLLQFLAQSADERVGVR